MPTLNWIGKDAVVNHHKEVPFHLLRSNPKLSVGEDSGNLLIQGDNLLALKALLPHFVGQVKCIYIDPPYNTGEEEWVYNDAVNSPEMRAWLGKVVGGEAEDLSRHDKWLCMMFPIPPSNLGKAIYLQKLRFEPDKRSEFRLCYYMIGQKGRGKGKWLYGQFATMIGKEDLENVLSQARQRGWIS